MARARGIKPALFDNEILGEADPILTVLFIGLWTLADREGRLEDRPKRIRKALFGYRDDVDTDRLLDDLWRLGFIDRYSVDGLAVVQVVNFSKHQNPHCKEAPSDLPANENAGAPPPPTQAPYKHSTSTVQEPETPAPAGRTPDSLNLTPDTGLLTPDDGEPEPGKGTASPAVSSSDNQPIRFLRHLVHKHGYDELTTRSHQRNIAQARQWDADGVELCELDAAVVQSRRQLVAQGDEHDPPVSYLAKVLAGQRRSVAPTPSGEKAPSNHGNFAERDYLDQADGWTIAGGRS